MAKHGVPLAGPLGTGKPTFGPTRIDFNGVQACGHEERDLGITWPAPEAQGVDGQDPRRVHTSSATGKLGVQAGRWFAGATLNTRACDGDCSHESFNLPRVERLEDWQRRRTNRTGLVFAFCKTAYKPYDLAVTAALVILKHHEPRARVSSDGLDKDWAEARQICQHLLGYGAQYAFDDAGNLADETLPVTVNPARELLARQAAHDTMLHCLGYPIAIDDEENLADDIANGGCYDAPPTPELLTLT